MTDLVSYERADRIATIIMDDGKVNVFSIPMLKALHAAFDRAEQDQAVVILTGRPGYFSAGFDLKVFQQEREPILEMLTLGARLAERIFTFPTPVVATCSGHGYPAGAFLMLASDVRIGIPGPYAIGLNEVRIGLTVPWFAIELARHRLLPAWFDRCVNTSTMCSPNDAVTAGFLDRVVPAEELMAAGREVAEELTKLDPTAYVGTKLRVRGRAIEALRAGIESELAVA